MKKLLPTIVTTLLIVVSGVYLAQRSRSINSESATNPEDVIWRMMDAAREGNSEAYLDCFSGALRQNLERTAAEMGNQRFREYLRRLNDQIVGLATSDLERLGETEARLNVEFVYRGKTETQKHHFRLVDGSWKIEQIDSAAARQNVIPYGTEVDQEEDRRDR